MKHSRKTAAVILILCLLISLLSGCEKQEKTAEDTNLSVFASFYPIYAAAQLITQDTPNVHLNSLVQPQDGCLRDYQLSDWDLALLQASDMVIIGGRGLEGFENLLYALGENGPAVAPVLYNMELTQMRAVNTQDDAQSHWLDPNPHIYMRSDAMLQIVSRIADVMILLDPVNEAFYRENLESASENLNALTAEIESVTSELSGEKVIVMNEALIYAAQQYGLNIDLCYERESGESFHDTDLEACLQMLDKSDAEVVFIEKQAPKELCDALKSAGFKLACLDVLSTRRANEGSEAYFEALRANAHAAKAAFHAANLPS